MDLRGGAFVRCVHVARVAGNEVGGILSQAGLVLFGNHNQQGFNQVTLIYYANWI